MDTDSADTVSPAIQSYIKQRLQNTYQNSPHNTQKNAAAFSLAIDALRRSEDPYSAEECLNWLIRSAQYGNQTSQSLVYRFQIALACEMPESAGPQVKEWIIGAAQRNYPAAQDDLRLVTTPEEFRSVWQSIRSRFAGMGWNRFAQLYPKQEFRLENLDATLCKWIFQSVQDPNFNTGTFIFNDERDNILHFAASAGFATVVQLWSHPMPIDINSQGADEETALLHACRSGHYYIARKLLELGADPRIPNFNGDTPLHWIIAFDGSSADELAVELVRKGANPNAAAKSLRYEFAPLCSYDGGTPLHRTVSRGKLDAVKALLKVGASAIDLGGREDGVTPLYRAAELHYPDLLELLIRSLDHERPAAALYSGVSLLVPAICGDKMYGEKFSKIARHGLAWWTKARNTLDLLLEWGATTHLHCFPPQSTTAGCTALFVATALGLPEMVKYLLEKGCETDINVPTYLWPTDTPYTPLCQAIFGRRKETFKILLEHGASRETLHVDENGNSLTYLYQCAAACHADSSFAEELGCPGVSVDAGPDDYETPFACAVRNRCFALAEWLLKQGADPHKEYQKGLLIDIQVPRSLLGILIMEQARSALVCIDFVLKRVPGTEFVVCSKYGHTALHDIASVRWSRRDEEACDIIADTLISHFKPGEDEVNKQNILGHTAIYLAVSMNNHRLVKRLLDLRANPLIEDENGFSAVLVNKAMLHGLDDDPKSSVDEFDSRPPARQIEAVRRRRECIQEYFAPFEELEKVELIR
jgi:ankyrin repeat protein